MNINVGDTVTRKSYNNDMYFKVIRIAEDKVYLKGVYVRLCADSDISDLIKVDEIPLDDFKTGDSGEDLQRDDYFYLPGKVLHIDADDEYLEKCLKYYKASGVYAVGKKIDESLMYQQIYSLLSMLKPDILIITGHDAFNKKDGDKNNLNSYKNSLNFIKAVKEARRFEKCHDKLVIIAGACQSDYEELIKAGANFASSPKRINIHALDPAIVASSIALTKKGEEIDIKNILAKTRFGSDGIGGIITNGLMYVGYPR